jgi:YD repeat-containing protein
LDPLGGQTLFELGPFGTTAARADPTGERHEFAFDSELRQTSVTNSAGAAWQYVHDAAGRLVSETDFIGRTLTYEYDAAGQLTVRVDALGNRSEFTRDPAGRITIRRTGDGDFAYKYDAMGRLTRAAGPSGADVVYDYDAAGQVVSETVDGHQVVSEYDAAGRRIRRTSPSGAVSAWSFDAVGRPAALLADAGRPDFQYDAASRLTSVVFGPQARLEQGMDAVGRLVTQRLWTEERPFTAGQPALGRDITYRPDGTPTAVTDTLRGIRRYSLDPAGRVTDVRAEAWSESYAYDAYGTVTQADMPAAPEATGPRTVDQTLIRQAGRTSYEYDAAGRLVRAVRRSLDGRRREWTYTWNTDDQLTRVKLPDGTTWRYRYDPLGRRTAKDHVADGTVVETVRFAWDGDLLVEQHTSGGDGGREVWTWDYDPATSRPTAQRRRHWVDDAPQEAVDEAFHAIVTDQLGTPSELVDEDGRIAWHTTTSLWGKQAAVAAEDGVDCPLRFPGQYLRRRDRPSLQPFPLLRPGDRRISQP